MPGHDMPPDITVSFPLGSDRDRIAGHRASEHSGRLGNMDQSSALRTSALWNPYREINRPAAVNSQA